MAGKNVDKGYCANCRQEQDCHFAALLRGTDIGILQQESTCDQSCWREWIQELGADPDKLIDRLQLPSREFKANRTVIVRALLHLLEPVDRAPSQKPYIQSEASYNLLFARDRWGEGYFLVGHGYRDTDVFDVDQYDLLMEEAREAGIQPPYHVFGHRQQFNAPTIHFVQLGSCEVRRLIDDVHASD